MQDQVALQGSTTATITSNGLMVSTIRLSESETLDLEGHLPDRPVFEVAVFPTEGQDVNYEDDLFVTRVEGREKAQKIHSAAFRLAGSAMGEDHASLRLNMLLTPSGRPYIDDDLIPDDLYAPKRLN